MLITPEIIEKAAKALYEDDGWEDADYDVKYYHRECAERMIMAIVEDLPEETYVAPDTCPCCGVDSSGVFWPTCVDVQYRDPSKVWPSLHLVVCEPRFSGDMNELCDDCNERMRGLLS